MIHCFDILIISYFLKTFLFCKMTFFNMSLLTYSVIDAILKKHFPSVYKVEKATGASSKSVLSEDGATLLRTFVV